MTFSEFFNPFNVEHVLAFEDILNKLDALRLKGVETTIEEVIQLTLDVTVFAEVTVVTMVDLDFVLKKMAAAWMSSVHEGNVQGMETPPEIKTLVVVSAEDSDSILH